MRVSSIHISETIPDAEALLALGPDELGIRMLPHLQLFAGPGTVNSFEVAQYVSLVVPSYEGQHRQQVALAVREAWAWLEGAAYLLPVINQRGAYNVRELSRRARQMASQPDDKVALAARMLPRASIHNSIRDDVWPLFSLGKLSLAVFAAVKGVEVAVREAAGLLSKDIGAPLMRKAFDPNSGPLTDMTVDVPEREARSALFAGTLGSYKNPHSHRNVDLDDPEEAAEIITLTSHLLRIVDDRREARRQASSNAQ